MFSTLLLDINKTLTYRILYKIKRPFKKRVSLGIVYMARRDSVAETTH